MKPKKVLGSGKNNSTKMKILQKNEKKYGNLALVTGHVWITHIKPFTNGRYAQSQYGIGGSKLETNLETHFWNLSNRVRFNIQDAYLKEMFDKASQGDLYQLAKKLKISYPFIVTLRRGVYSIPRDMLISIIELAEIDRLDMERHITSARTRHGNVAKINFPIIASPELASLVGHVFGDGYIGARKRQFEYCNDNISLLNEVNELVFSLFSLYPMTKRTNRIGYSTIVGEVLELCGAPLAPKVTSVSPVPKWIEEGSQNIQAAFIKALFNDDGSVMFSEKYNAIGLNLYQIRDLQHKDFLNSFMKTIQKMLGTFSVYSGDPLIRKVYVSNGKERVITYLNITNFASIVNYHQKISLTEGRKYEKLTKIAALRKTPRKFKTTFSNQEVKHVTQPKPKKVLVLGSGAIKIGEAGESA